MTERLAFSGQLAARLDGGASGTETIFLLQIDGAAPEVALANVPSSDLSIAAGKATATREGEHTVLRGIAAGTAEFASVKVGQTKVVLVLLPWEMRDRVWCVRPASHFLLGSSQAVSSLFMPITSFF